MSIQDEYCERTDRSALCTMSGQSFARPEYTEWLERLVYDMRAAIASGAEPPFKLRANMEKEKQIQALAQLIYDWSRK